MTTKTKIGKALLFALIVALSFNVIFAFSGSGSGTQGDPYIITTPSQFVEIELDMDAYYELGNDIDFTGVTDFFGIGDWNSWDVGDGFNGSFDGKGYTISNIVQDDTNNINNDAGGVFGLVYGGTIRNVSIVDTTIISQIGIDQHSCFIGTMSSSFYGTFTPNFLAEYITIENCVIYGDTGGSFATLIGGYSDDVSDVRFENINAHSITNLNTQPGTIIGGLYVYIDGFNGQTMYFENITGNFTFDFNMTTANNPPFYTNVEFGGIASYMFSNSEYKNVKLDVSVYANDTFGSAGDGFAGLTYMYSAGITSANLYFGTDVTTIYEDVVIDFHERMTTQNPYVLSENTGGTTCTDTYFIINPGVTPVDTGCQFGSVTGVTRANANLESSFPGLDFVNTWTMEDEAYLTQFIATPPGPTIYEHTFYAFNTSNASIDMFSILGSGYNASTLNGSIFITSNTTDNLSVILSSSGYIPQNISFNYLNTTINVTLVTAVIPDNDTNQSAGVFDLFDGFDFFNAREGLSSCPLDNGETDRLFYLFIIVLSAGIFLFGYSYDNAIFGLIGSAMIGYVSIISLPCDLYLAGFGILLAVVGAYLSLTQLSLTKD